MGRCGVVHRETWGQKLFLEFSCFLEFSLGQDGVSEANVASSTHQIHGSFHSDERMVASQENKKYRILGVGAADV